MAPIEDHEAQQTPAEGLAERKQRETNIADAMKTILSNLGTELDDEVVNKTPERFARAMLHFTSGYDKTQHADLKRAIFKVGCNDMVVVRDIDVSSLCEHHVVPFSGKIHIAYMPKGNVLGLSKFARIVEKHARRLQVQERLTKDVAEEINTLLKPDGVAVVAECSHMCMSMRGVKQIGATTLTQCKIGVFDAKPGVYEHFHSLLSMPRK